MIIYRIIILTALISPRVLAKGVVSPELLSELLPDSLPEPLPDSLPEPLPEPHQSHCQDPTLFDEGNRGGAGPTSYIYKGDKDLKYLY